MKILVTAPAFFPSPGSALQEEPVPKKTPKRQPLSPTALLDLLRQGVDDGTIVIDLGRRPKPGPKPKPWLPAIERGLAQAERDGQLIRRRPPLLPLYEGRAITNTVIATFMMPPATEYGEKARQKYAARWINYTKGLLHHPDQDVIQLRWPNFPAFLINTRTGRLVFVKPAAE